MHVDACTSNPYGVVTGSVPHQTLAQRVDRAGNLALRELLHTAAVQ